MKTKIILTALAFVAFTTAGIAGEAKGGCCKENTECSKSKDASKTKTDGKTAKTVKTADVKK